MVAACMQVAAGRIRPDDSLSIALWGGVLIVVIVAGALVINWVRRRIYARDDVGDKGNIWTLDGLRELRAEGMIDDAEYNRLRQAIIDSFGATSKADATPADANAPGDSRPAEPPGVDPPAAPPSGDSDGGKGPADSPGPPNASPKE